MAKPQSPRASTPRVDDGAPEKWNTLAKRLRWVVANRRPTVTSLEDWSVKTGHSRQYLSSAIKRANESDGSLNLRDAAALIDLPGLNIDLWWLATGRGDPATGRREIEDIWPKRLAAARRAMAQGVAYETIARVRRETSATPNAFIDDSEATWYRRFLEEDHHRLRLLTLPTSRTGDDEND